MKQYLEEAFRMLKEDDNINDKMKTILSFFTKEDVEGIATVGGESFLLAEEAIEDKVGPYMKRMGLGDEFIKNVKLRIKRKFGIDKKEQLKDLNPEYIISLCYIIDRAMENQENALDVALSEKTSGKINKFYSDMDEDPNFPRIYKMVARYYKLDYNKCISSINREQHLEETFKACKDLDKGDKITKHNTKLKEEFKPFFFNDDDKFWEDESQYVGDNLSVESFMDEYDNYDEFINSEFTAKVLGAYGNTRENKEMRKYFEENWPQKAKLAHRLFDTASKVDSKMSNKLQEGYLGQTLYDFLNDCLDLSAIDKLEIANNDEDEFTVIYSGKANLDKLGEYLLSSSFADFDTGMDSVVINAEKDGGGTDYYSTVSDFVDDYNGDEVNIEVDGEQIFSGFKDDIPDEILDYGFVSYDGSKYLCVNVSDLDNDLDKNQEENDNVINEGTWALPNTKEKASALIKLLDKPLYVEDEEKLYDLIGDDSLFDKIDHLKKANFKGTINDLIKSKIIGLIKYYYDSPKKFKDEWDKDSLEMLKNSCK